MNRNLLGNIYGRSCKKIAHFVPIRYQTWRQRRFLFLIGRFLKIFSCETVWQMNRNLVGSIYLRSSLKNAHFFRFLIKHGGQSQFLFLIGRFLKIFSSETDSPNEPKPGMKYIWKFSIKIPDFVLFC